MSERDLAADTNNRVGKSANSFDMFTIRLTGSKFNGAEEIIDESGGLVGRLGARVEILEAGFKAHTRMLLGMGLLIMVNTGIEKASSIGELLDKLKGLFH
jgi:hypothetical protein